MRDFKQTYKKMVENIKEKFDQLEELNQKRMIFTGTCLKNYNYSKFKIVHTAKYTDEFYFKTKDNFIEIVWFDEDNCKFSVVVSPLFFEDFNTYLDIVQDEITARNKEEIKKYINWVKEVEEIRARCSAEDYQLYLKLREIYKK